MKHKYLKIFFAVAGMQLYLLIVTLALSSSRLFYGERGTIAAIISVIVMFFILRVMLIKFQISHPLLTIFFSTLLGAFPFIFFVFLGIGYGKPIALSSTDRSLYNELFSGLAFVGCFLSFPISFTIISMLFGRHQKIKT